MGGVNGVNVKESRKSLSTYSRGRGVAAHTKAWMAILVYGLTGLAFNVGINGGEALYSWFHLIFPVFFFFALSSF